MNDYIKIIDEIITIIINGSYPNINFSTVNNCIIGLNELKKNIDTGEDIDNELIDSTIRIIMNGVFSNYTFLTINDAIIKLNNFKRKEKEKKKSTLAPIEE